MDKFDNLVRIVNERWEEAIKEPSIPRFRSLAQLAALMADDIAATDPDNILVPTLDGVYRAAYDRMLKMTPPSDKDFS